MVPSPLPLRTRARSIVRPIVLTLIMTALLLFRRGAGVDDLAPNAATALAGAMHARGLFCEEHDVRWVDGPRGVRGAMLGTARALVRASLRDEPSDLYLVDARLSPEGVLLDVGSIYNLTRTIGVDEDRPILRGLIAAYTTSVDGTTTGVHTLDLAGRSMTTLADFSRVQRWQTAITNLQQTGQTTGVTHDAFALDPVAAHVHLAWQSGGLLEVDADGRAIVLDPQTGKAVEGGGWVREAPEERARPGNLVPWAVNRVRALPWFGDDRMQWLKAIAFTGLDWALRARAALVKDTSERDVDADLGTSAATRAKAPVYTDPELGWPPGPMKPLMLPPLPGEGQWVATDDPFVARAPGLPTPFVTSFLRCDRERRDTRVYVTLWDPRQIALHMQAGTVEPVSATGEAGPGLIPRAPEVMKRVVAGFNGGFQAMHGEYGMEVDGVLYLPPKPYAATVMELRDGTTAFGAWPRATEVPDDVLSFRQNLTALVQNDRFNPWGRVWWGGTPPGWQDNIHTTRSGICLTKDKFVGYFFGNDISADVLAAAMLAANCSFGIHLDMNPGLVGFEFYSVQPAEHFTPLGRPLQPDWEYEGALRDFPGLRVRSRRMVRSMASPPPPQYFRRETRDFFYLTQRPTLPGMELTPPIRTPQEPGEGVWHVKGLPQHGFPYAVAMTSMRVDATHPSLHASVLRVDPRVVRAAGSPGTNEETPTVVSFIGPLHTPRAGELGIWLSEGAFLAGRSAPAEGAMLAVGESFEQAAREADSVKAAVGIHDEDGMLEWIELPSDAPADGSTLRAMDTLLASDGCGTRVFLAAEAHALLGATLTLEGTPASAFSGTSSRLVRGQAPGAQEYFPDTPIVGPSVWQPLQSQRIRYFYHPKPAPSASGSSSVPAPPPSVGSPNATLH
jgi:hypothetical protein